MKNNLAILIIITLLISCNNKTNKSLSYANYNKNNSQNLNEKKSPHWSINTDTILEKNNPKYLDLTKHQLFIDTTRNSIFYKNITQWKPDEMYAKLINSEIEELIRIQKNNKVSIKSFPKKWINLRKYKGEYIIYKPCDGKTFSIEISESNVIFCGIEPSVDIITKLNKQTKDELVMEMKTLERSKIKNSKLSIFKTKFKNVYELIYSTENSSRKYYVTPINKIAEYDMIVNNCVKIKLQEFQGFDDFEKPIDIEVIN